jgi:hypothetical protein
MAVRTYGGVLEHPAHSQAWKAYGLSKPLRSGWRASFDDPGWTCEVDQAHYGHPCNKRTWLYCVGCDEATGISWGRAPFTGRTVRSDGGGGRDQRSRTPPAFRDVLLDMARSARAAACA